MKAVLLIFLLNTQSSYLQNQEIAASESNADTVQFFISNGHAWRIRTFAMDQDVHVHSLGQGEEDIETTVSRSTESTYGDIMTQKLVFISNNGLAGIKEELKKAGLSPTIEESKRGFAFWVPYGTHYRTKSSPVAKP